MNPIAQRLAARLFDRPIIQNQFRSAFVEAMIEPYLAPAGWRFVGDNWNGFDFEYADGARLEVKQSAAQQAWSTARKLVTPGTFDIAPRNGYFCEDGAKYFSGQGRPAHVYVFAWHGVIGEAADHRLADQWQFYVLRADRLPANQKTIRRSKMAALAGVNCVHIDELCETVKRTVVRIELSNEPSNLGKLALANVQ